MDSQTIILGIFQGLLDGGQVDLNRMSRKVKDAESEFLFAHMKFEVWKQHKQCLSQIQGMRWGIPQLTCKPSPLPFTTPNLEQIIIFTFLEVGKCCFCSRGLEHAWDCRIVSCQHPYHSWCTVSHFFTTTKCLVKRYEQEMHVDWWILLEIQ